MSERHEIWQLLDELQMNNRADAAKLVSLRSFVSGLDLPTPADLTCPNCGIKRSGPRTLAEHLHQLHGGPLPEHWTAADALVASHTRAQASVDQEPSLDEHEVFYDGDGRSAHG